MVLEVAMVGRARVVVVAEGMAATVVEMVGGPPVGMAPNMEQMIRMRMVFFVSTRILFIIQPFFSPFFVLFFKPYQFP